MINRIIIATLLLILFLGVSVSRAQQSTATPTIFGALNSTGSYIPYSINVPFPASSN